MFRNLMALLLTVLMLGCAQSGQLVDPNARVIEIDIERLAAGDLRHNAVVRDGDQVWVSDEALFEPARTSPLLRSDLADSRWRLRPIDRLRVTIYELETPGMDAFQDLTVSANGVVNVDRVGSFDAKGELPEQLESLIAGVLEERDGLRNATVSVVLTNRQRVFTFNASAFPASGLPNSSVVSMPMKSVRLIDAFYEAGFDGKLPNHVYLVRKHPEPAFVPPAPVLSEVRIGGDDDWSEPVFP